MNQSDAEQIAEILERRANEVAGYYDDCCKTAVSAPGSVEMALDREIKRLRRLAESTKTTVLPIFTDKSLQSAGQELADELESCIPGDGCRIDLATPCDFCVTWSKASRAVDRWKTMVKQ